MAYVPDNLIKYDCCYCEEQFIVSEYVVKKIGNVQCPYCGSMFVDENAGIRDELKDELGCFGIYHEESEVEQDGESTGD